MKRAPSVQTTNDELFASTLGSGYSLVLKVHDKLDDLLGAHESFQLLLGTLFYRFEADGETLVFSGTDADARVLTLLDTNPTIFIDGVRMDPATFTADLATDTVTFVTAPDLGSIIHISQYGENVEEGTLYFSSLTSQDAVETIIADALAAKNAAEIAAETYEEFNERYLGPKENDPILDNGGDALQIGALYFNSTANEMRMWGGATWIAAYAGAVPGHSDYGLITDSVMPGEFQGTIITTPGPGFVIVGNEIRHSISTLPKG